ncbi:hypothetical protein TNCV_4201661 [Trichonephila clavipes]|uniref:Uncharacterized protein n=1 Tax=Trichonephila clavipes TaxID=2585209 RepID=A0A8X6WBJ0_TRICX|nr:hypothetical protein TNCV_4201661 [Trichonephila clavipes]
MDDLSLLVVTSQISGQALYLGGVDQPQNTEAYPLDLTHCTRLVDVTWLTWLDDWEMHRDENVPWRVVSLQPWKRALETHVERSHQNALALGMPSDVLEHI